MSSNIETTEPSRISPESRGGRRGHFFVAVCAIVLCTVAQ